VKLNAKQKACVLVLGALLPILPAVAQVGEKPESQPVVEVDPLDKYRGATKLTDSELVDLLSQVGFKGNSLKLAWAIAKKESNGRPLAHNDNVGTGDNSYGIFQINMMGSLGEDRREKFGLVKNSDLLDPVTNAQAAFYMSAKGTNFGSWGWGRNAYDGDPAEPKISQWLEKFPEQ
jgi:hypothetical protein